MKPGDLVLIDTVDFYRGMGFILEGEAGDHEGTCYRVLLSGVDAVYYFYPEELELISEVVDG